MVHAYVSMFFLPLALFYAITGAALVLTPDRPHGAPPPGLEARQGQADAGPASRGASAINDQARGEGPEGGSGKQGIEEPTGFSKLLLVHKAKGAVAFKVLGMLFAAAMVFLYVSGICAVWRARDSRKQLLLTGAAGLIVTVVVLAASL